MLLTKNAVFMEMHTHLHLYEYSCVAVSVCDQPSLRVVSELTMSECGWNFCTCWCHTEYKSLCRINEFSRIKPDCTTAAVASLTVGTIWLMCSPLLSSAPSEFLQSCAFIQGQSSQRERQPFPGGLGVSDYILLLTHQKALVVHRLCSVHLFLMYEKLCILVKILVWVYEEMSDREKVKHIRTNLINKIKKLRG